MESCREGGGHDGKTLYPGGEDTGWVVFQGLAGGEVQRIKFAPFLADFAAWFAVP